MANIKSQLLEQLAELQECLAVAQRALDAYSDWKRGFITAEQAIRRVGGEDV